MKGEDEDQSMDALKGTLDEHEELTVDVLTLLWEKVKPYLKKKQRRKVLSDITEVLKNSDIAPFCEVDASLWYAVEESIVDNQRRRLTL